MPTVGSSTISSSDIGVTVGTDSTSKPRAPRKPKNMKNYSKEDDRLDPPRYPPGDDVENRLSGTWVMYRGEPVYVSGVVGSNVLEVFSPLKGLEWESAWIHSSSVELNVNAQPLGFLNCADDNMAYYLRRAPRRRNRQGLYDEVCSAEAVMFGRAGSMTSLRHFPKHEIAKMLKGMYPTVQEALERAETGHMRSVAFDRRFAIVPDYQGSKDKDKWIYYLYHKTTMVGFLERQGVAIVATFFSEHKNSEFFTLLSNHNIGLTS